MPGVKQPASSRESSLSDVVHGSHHRIKNGMRSALGQRHQACLRKSRLLPTADR